MTWSWLTPEENAALDALWAEEEAEEKVIDALHQLRDVTAEYPEALLAARRAGFVTQIEAINDDPRTAEQIDMDEWQADARATRESDRPQ